MDNRKAIKELERLGNALLVIGSGIESLKAQLEQSVAPAASRQRQNKKDGRKAHYTSMIRTRITSKRSKIKTI